MLEELLDRYVHADPSASFGREVSGRDQDEVTRTQVGDAFRISAQSAHHRFAKEAQASAIAASGIWDSHGTSMRRADGRGHRRVDRALLEGRVG